MLQLNDTYETPWVEYNIPASTGNYQSSHSQQYLLQDLAPDSEYVATMHARNVFGATEITEEFFFRTAAGWSRFTILAEAERFRLVLRSYRLISSIVTARCLKPPEHLR